MSAPLLWCSVPAAPGHSYKWYSENEPNLTGKGKAPSLLPSRSLAIDPREVTSLDLAFSVALGQGSS